MRQAYHLSKFGQQKRSRFRRRRWTRQRSWRSYALGNSCGKRARKTQVWFRQLSADCTDDADELQSAKDVFSYLR